MIFPPPLPGQVIRYSFLWSHEVRSGATEGRKDRPCAIVLAVPRDAHGDTRVAVVPITHTPPRTVDIAIELPAAVKTALGLDPEPSWICLDELNAFSWPGYDLRPVPGTNNVAYGSLPKELFEQVRQGVLALNRARRIRQANRD